MTDTTPEVAGMVRRRIMALSGSEHFLMGVRMCEAARRMVLASFPPDLTGTERKRRLFERYHNQPLPTPGRRSG